MRGHNAQAFGPRDHGRPGIRTLLGDGRPAGSRRAHSGSGNPFPALNTTEQHVMRCCDLKATAGSWEQRRITWVLSR